VGTGKKEMEDVNVKSILVWFSTSKKEYYHSFYAEFLFIFFFFTIILCALLIFNIQWSKSLPFSLEKKEQISQKLQ
jgi:glycerol uptake facilitator-like aquaporin